jgi:hypothetical protein
VKKQVTNTNSEEIYAKTVAEIKERLTSDLGIETISRVDVKTGEPYVLVHGRGTGAELLYRILVAHGLITPDPRSTRKVQA